MRPLVEEICGHHTPESLVHALGSAPGVVLLRSGLFEMAEARYSFIAARPFLTFRSFGSRCELEAGGQKQIQFGDPWRLLESLMSRFELLDEVDLPFPLGGCFGYWGYDLKNFVEPKLSRRAVNDLELPDCHVGFYDSLVVFDHRLGKTWIVSTGLRADGSRDAGRARERAEFWKGCLGCELADAGQTGQGRSAEFHFGAAGYPHGRAETEFSAPIASGLTSNLSREQFISLVERAQDYIHAGDIYQVNLCQRFSACWPFSGWKLFENLSTVSAAPFAAYLDCGDFQVCSASPELFLRLSGRHIQTRPIKGTRPRSGDSTRDAQLSYELQTSAKENAELVMITDLLRNDLGKVCEFGSVQVPELARLERYPQVQHLVSTVEGRLREDATHFSAFASCFPGGSVTGAPKFRAMEIIDELEPVTRGPYTGALGYLGFNRESQLSIVIRSAICRDGLTFFHSGAGIVADSRPDAEYEETMAKARGFFEALNFNATVRREIEFNAKTQRRKGARKQRSTANRRESRK
ncbi:MAG: aminodeoxychorismate synthase, component I [Verrucomicrobia bacterium]|nr:MAG: aminodeoxychorismate synthase, component I [Verrucomicrobiota bacterium]